MHAPRDRAARSGAAVRPQAGAAARDPPDPPRGPRACSTRHSSSCAIFSISLCRRARRRRRRRRPIGGRAPTAATGALIQAGSSGSGRGLQPQLGRRSSLVGPAARAARRAALVRSPRSQAGSPLVLDGGDFVAVGARAARAAEPPGGRPSQGRRMDAAARAEAAGRARGRSGEIARPRGSSPHGRAARVGEWMPPVIGTVHSVDAEHVPPLDALP